MKTKWLLCFCILLWTQACCISADLYVSPNGSDASRGTRSDPLASLAAARDAARAFAGKEPVTVHVADGVYYLPDTLTFTSADSGSALHPVRYFAENEGKAVLSGGSRLQLTWTPDKNGVFQAKTPAGLVIDQLFVDGRNQRMARYPNYDPTKKAEPYQGFAADAFSKARSAAWDDPAGGYIHAMHRKSWGGYHYRITGRKADGEVEYEGGWQNNRQMGMHEKYRMVENIFEELDAPGEWFHDAKTSTLYYKPERDVDLSNASVEVVRLRHLVEFSGSMESPVRFISLQGFTIRHAARTFMDCKEPLLRSDWAIYRGGAFLLTGTEDIAVLDCEFDQVGGNALFVNQYNRRTLVKGCHIHDAGASGVCFVGDPHAVRDPLFEYGKKNDLATIDRIPGPKSENYPADGIVADCLIHGIGRVERQPAGVMMDMASEITVRDCSIYDCARSGINIGDGAWGGHLIERCDVFDTVLETHDHGSFNSWGRDRYWRSDHLTASQAAVDAEPNLPFLDAVKTTVIRDSRWRCDHGWDIDLDDGSSNYDIYNNLLLNTGLKLREGFRRHAWNNVAPFGRLHPHVWFQRSRDQVTGNIFAGDHATARMSSPYVDETIVDRNFFASADQSILERSDTLGWDENSVLGDPMFVDPANGDFRVKDGSPALKLGFKNFPMDQFGVKKPSLKSKAESPKLISEPPVNRVRKTVRSAGSVKQRWLGAELRDLVGEEYSAYGVSKKDGGVALAKVPRNSVAARAGLRANDLVQAVNGKSAAEIGQLFRLLSKLQSASVTLRVVRDQKAIEVSLELPAVVVTETAKDPSGLVKLPVSAARKVHVTASQKTNNESLSSLTDGRLGKGFGPVFGNGIRNGAYKLDLGRELPVSAVTSWSYDMGQVRGTQKLTIYGSRSASDPGWDLNAFTQLGVIDTGDSERAAYTAASLRAASGKSLGSFRWIVWSVSPVTATAGGENTAFQELAVDVLRPVSAAVPHEKPNVVIVMTDDQGYGDLSCHGNPILKTPQLDRLYSESVRFTDFHVSPFCTPTRAALMTGNHAGYTGAFRTSSGRTMMHRDEKTIADLFGEHGYVTGMVGKWHLGDNAPHRPQDRGFQDVVWHRCGGVGQASDYWGNDYFDDTYERNGTFEKFDGYCTDVWFREGMRFIEENRSEPFLLYLALNAPHGPYLVPDEWAEPYAGNQDVANANFYGMIANIDHNMGLLREHLAKLGLAENTILIFMTDNGTSAGFVLDRNDPDYGPLDSLPVRGFNAGMRGRKSSVYEGGHRVPFFVHWPNGNLIGGKNVETLAMHIDVLPTIADLCELSVSDDYKPDGVSLKPLLKGQEKAWPRDHLVQQYLGGASASSLPPKENEHTVVMTEQWRLVNSGKERLFDIQEDPGQRIDLAAENPAVVKELRSLYQPYWEKVAPRLTPVRIDVGNPAENPTILCSQNWYMPSGNPPWNFNSIRKLPKVTGPWMIEVKQAGLYRLTLRQFPKEANKPLVAERAKIEVSGQTLEKAVDVGSHGVVFEISLPVGPTELVTSLYDKNGKCGGAYFTEVEALSALPQMAE